MHDAIEIGTEVFIEHTGMFGIVDGIEFINNVWWVSVFRGNGCYVVTELSSCSVMDEGDE